MTLTYLLKSAYALGEISPSLRANLDLNLTIRGHLPIHAIIEFPMKSPSSRLDLMPVSRYRHHAPLIRMRWLRVGLGVLAGCIRTSLAEDRPPLAVDGGRSAAVPHCMPSRLGFPQLSPLLCQR